MLKNFILVALGGCAGSISLDTFYVLINTKNFPYATLLVKFLGSFVIGMVLANSLKDQHFLYNWKLFLATGICRGFTTFSAFSLENLSLLQSQKYFAALFYIITSIILGITAAWLVFITAGSK